MRLENSTHIQHDDPFKRLGIQLARDVFRQVRKPAGAEEAMTYDKRAEVQKARRDDRRLLRRDDHSHGQVTLLSGETEEPLRQPFRSFRSDGPFGTQILWVYSLVRSYIRLRIRETTRLVSLIQNDHLATL
jgi:hypothetical protein